MPLVLRSSGGEAGGAAEVGRKRVSQAWSGASWELSWGCSLWGLGKDRARGFLAQLSPRSRRLPR